MMTKKMMLFYFFSLIAFPLMSLTEVVAESPPAKILGVDQFMNGVDQHKGPIRVEGVVIGVAPDKQMMAVVDTDQFRKCGILDCPTYLVLPVTWSGSMPLVKDVVRMQGQIKESGGKLMFEAKSLEKLALESGEAK